MPLNISMAFKEYKCYFKDCASLINLYLLRDVETQFITIISGFKVKFNFDLEMIN